MCLLFLTFLSYFPGSNFARFCDLRSTSHRQADSSNDWAHVETVNAHERPRMLWVEYYFSGVDAATAGHSTRPSPSRTHVSISTEAILYPLEIDFCYITKFSAGLLCTGIQFENLHDKSRLKFFFVYYQVKNYSHSFGRKVATFLLNSC